MAIYRISIREQDHFWPHDDLSTAVRLMREELDNRTVTFT